MLGGAAGAKKQSLLLPRSLRPVASGLRLGDLQRANKQTAGLIVPDRSLTHTHAHAVALMPFDADTVAAVATGAPWGLGLAGCLPFSERAGGRKTHNERMSGGGQIVPNEPHIFFCQRDRLQLLWKIAV